MHEVYQSSLKKMNKKKRRQKKEKTVAGHQWLMPIMLATQEAEIRKIAVGSQPGK
jgi:hypothetical protein